MHTFISRAGALCLLATVFALGLPVAASAMSYVGDCSYYYGTCYTGSTGTYSMYQQPYQGYFTVQPINYVQQGYTLPQQQYSYVQPSVYAQPQQYQYYTQPQYGYQQYGYQQPQYGYYGQQPTYGSYGSYQQPSQLYKQQATRQYPAYGYPTGDTTILGQDLCYYADYGVTGCGFDPRQRVWDPWTMSWY